MKTIILSICLLLFFKTYPQEKVGRTNVKSDTFGIEDRVGGTHNAGNVGLFFENRGKLYPRYATLNPSGEFPINSTKNYIYRINPMVGIPGNIIQCRYTVNEEWEAVGGYHNPNFNEVAFSDNPQSWQPINGWPVKDSLGNPIFISDQDSYCVYSDSNNTNSLLNIFIHQTGYVFANDSCEDIIFFKYEVMNNSLTNYDSLYFSLYCDIDVGDISGGLPEYGDDKVGFDRENNFLFFYDDGYSQEWPDSTTGYFGVVFLETPQTTQSQFGITDFHYNLYEDDLDIDTLQFGIISSSEGIFNSNYGHNYFHPGATNDLHFDDTATIPQSGIDIVSNISSGPYSLSSNESLIFYTAFIGGNDYNDIYQNMIISKNILRPFITDNNENITTHQQIGYGLSQNYPNPFNPSTKISWQSPVGSWQTLKVYDILGNEVATLVNEEKPAGIYEVEFDASVLSSGVYFYQLQVDNFIETRKMILLR